MRNDEMLIGGLPIEVIRKKNLKNLYVRVNPPEGNVTVSTPMELSDEDIKLFVLKKLPEGQRQDALAGEAEQAGICVWRVPLPMGKALPPAGRL